MTSRTELSDLTAGFDAVRRLADAQVNRLLPAWAYVEPGVLWWAFDPASAAARGHDASVELDEKQRAQLPDVEDPRVREDRDEEHVVVLLDEIDKAEPDLPNDLLEPLDRLGFLAPGNRPVDAAREVLVVITSNGERRLPPAFLRRCVQLELRLSDDPAEQQRFFVAVARAHFGVREDDRYQVIAREFVDYRQAAAGRNRREPSTAEYLDTVRASLRFNVSPGTDSWKAIVEIALWKDADLPEGRSDADAS
jgi:MoxR-like ATPase